MQVNGNSNPRKAIFVGVLTGISLVLLLFTMTRCSDSGPAGPSGNFNSGPSNQSGADPAPAPAIGTTASGDNGSAPNTCSRSDISPQRRKTLDSIEVDGREVTGTCFGDANVPGRFFCKVYVDERGGDINDKADIGEQWSLTLPDDEPHKIVIDFEVDLDHDGDTDCQNDGTNVTLEAEVEPEDPVCDLVQLRQQAGQECGELGFELDENACSFTCNVCDVESLSVEANAAAKSECRYGVDEIFLNEEACTFSFECEEPTCEELNPRQIFGGGGTWSVVERNRIFSRASVSVPYSIGGAAFNGEVQILWKNGNSTTVKERLSVSKRCGAQAGGTITWNNDNNSHNHLCFAGHVNGDAQYFLRFVEGGNVRETIELSRTGSRCNVN